MFFLVSVVKGGWNKYWIVYHRHRLPRDSSLGVRLPPLQQLLLLRQGLQVSQAPIFLRQTDKANVPNDINEGVCARVLDPYLYRLGSNPPSENAPPLRSENAPSPPSKNVPSSIFLATLFLQDPVRVFYI